MNWEETLKNELMNSVQMDYEHLYRICYDAYKRDADMKSRWLLKHTGLDVPICSETDV
ncbi:hypothetical protein [uncultured Parabacteroides sp.]|jgi:hypothetical protein|uniref:hypothetical protein n=1 Tax=uncultured Parabacteroides sp. TaxID=512312 RepID=UPI0035A5C509